MVLPELDEVEYSFMSEKDHTFSSLGRQASIYSLTLDEFQHTLCENGKSFWSMNMDELLTSIFNAEDTVNNNGMVVDNNQMQLSLNETAAISINKSIARQASLASSITIPAPLCRKTVDEVWSEIQGGQQEQPQNIINSNMIVHSSEAAPRQATFGREMTLEDFLVKAGIMREHITIPAPPQAQAQEQEQEETTTHQNFGMYQSNSNRASTDLSFPTRSVVIGIPSSSNAGVVGPAYQQVPPGRGVMVDSSMFLGNDKRNSWYSAPPQQQQQPPPVCYSERIGNGSGYVSCQPMEVVAPASPHSSEGMCFDMDMGGMMRGKKRILDGPVEKVVERRQRRMIKNRESAARSRARKQAYTVELEAELNQLKDKNTQLKQDLAALEKKRNQHYFEELKLKAHSKAQKAKDKLTMSCPL